MPRSPAPGRALTLGLVLVPLFVAAGAAFVMDSRRELLPPTAAVPLSGPAPATTLQTQESPAGDPGDDGTAPEEVESSAQPTTPTEAPTTTAPAGPDDWMQTVGERGRVFLGVSTESDTLEEIQAFAVAAQRVPDVVLISRDWASGGFDRQNIERLTDAGHLPMIAWEPWSYQHVLSGDRLRAVQPAYTLQTIIDGDHDEMLRTWARDAADWGRPLVLRFAHEMNGYWYPWAESANGNQDGEYVLAWRHVVDLFEEEGADNVVWVWSPNLSQPTLTPLVDLWPGDDYVDWVGLVGYLGNGIDPSIWTPTFDELFGPTLEELRAFTDHPIVITEIGATEKGGNKAEWITGILDAVAGRDDVIGLMWFEIDKEADWRIVSSPEAQAAFAEGVSDDAIWGVPRGGRSTRELVATLPPIN